MCVYLHSILFSIKVEFDSLFLTFFVYIYIYIERERERERERRYLPLTWYQDNLSKNFTLSMSLELLWQI